MSFRKDGPVQEICFGTGDILIHGGLLDDPNKTIGCVSIMPGGFGVVGEKYNHGCVLDTDLDVHTRLIFTDIRSIDVVIEHLEQTKRLMRED